jgi:serine/threonine-protein kinase RsbW
MEILADISELVAVRAWLTNAVQEVWGLSHVERNNIVVAVDEAVANIIVHGYQENNHERITIVLQVTSGLFHVEIRDTAAPFNPPDAPSVNLVLLAKQHKKGGLGLLLISRIMDSVEYKQRNDSQPYNALILEKRCSHDQL